MTSTDPADPVPTLADTRRLWLRQYLILTALVSVAVVSASLAASFTLWALDRHRMVDLSELIPASTASDVVALALMGLAALLLAARLVRELALHVLPPVSLGAAAEALTAGLLVALPLTLVFDMVWLELPLAPAMTALACAIASLLLMHAAIPFPVAEEPAAPPDSAA